MSAAAMHVEAIEPRAPIADDTIMQDWDRFEAARAPGHRRDLRTIDRAVHGAREIVALLAEDRRARNDLNDADEGEVLYTPMTPLRIEALQWGLDLLLDQAAEAIQHIRCAGCGPSAGGAP